ncbi:MAG TPA: hypothetical protein VNI61_06590 [Gemmatimonadales bacterium]|nr:hypothetical protein [Gemmatimonadales bacterium]
MSAQDFMGFDHHPDPELGAALRAALEPRDQAAFVARVMARFDQARAVVPAWEVLARWAGRGIAAAALLALAAALALGRGQAPGSLDEALIAATDPGTSVTTALLVGEGPPDPGTVFAAVVGAER